MFQKIVKVTSSLISNICLTITIIMMKIFKGIQTSENRNNLFEYFEFVFLQERHWSVSNENKWENEFSGNLLFPLTVKQKREEL